MAKYASQLTVEVVRNDSNSGSRSVPKLNGASPVEPLPVLLSSLFPYGSPVGPSKDFRNEISHSRGSLLFVEGQPAAGAFVIEAGCGKLTMCSGRGKSLILGFFGPHSFLGLPAAILGLPYEATAEIMKPATTRFIPREHLLHAIKQDGEAGLRAAQLVSQMLHSTLREIETFWLTDSVEQKLARFLVSICPPRNGYREVIRLRLDLTHEEIAQRIGVSRETVTRFLSRFKKRGILDLKRSILTILDPAALERLADLRDEHRGVSCAPSGYFR
jgi:CRP-like cAMP-binding protein